MENVGRDTEQKDQNREVLGNTEWLATVETIPGWPVKRENLLYSTRRVVSSPQRKE